MQTIFLENKLSHVSTRMSLIIFLVIVGCTLCANLSPYDPQRADVSIRFQPPSLYHLAGTDALGRDVLTRTLYGGRVSLLVGFSVAFVSLLLGVPVGLIAGYFGDPIDNLLMRITDLFLSLPYIFILIIISMTYQDLISPSFDMDEIVIVVLSISLVSWMPLARLIRSHTRTLRNLDFITASYALGASNFHIIVNHILPNTSNIIVVTSTLQVVGAVLMEAFLSFIGFGIHPRIPTWGNMLSNNHGELLHYPWAIFTPAIALIITVIVINNLGDSLNECH